MTEIVWIILTVVLTSVLVLFFTRPVKHVKNNCIRDIWLVCESDGIKVKVVLDGFDEWITVISENKCYDIDGSPSLISHTINIRNLPTGGLVYFDGAIPSTEVKER
jgi:hypothetical protein